MNVLAPPRPRPDRVLEPGKRGVFGLTARQEGAEAVRVVLLNRPLGYASSMQTWLTTHEFLASWLATVAAWLAVVISALGMLLQARRTGAPFKWDSATLRIGFLICLAALLTPSIPAIARGSVGVLAAMSLGSISARANRE